MTTTPKLALAHMEPSQAQKHVTFNQALKKLDAQVQLSVLDRNLNVPPNSGLSNGDRYLIASEPSGAWAGSANKIAAWQDGTWVIYDPQVGWRTWIEDERINLYWNGSFWAGDGEIILGTNTVIAQSPNQAQTIVCAVEELLSPLSGASVTSTIAFPDSCIILGVSARVTTAITGATSYDCGDGLTVDRFGGSLGIALNSTNQGLINPAGNYNSTTVTLTANGGNFTAGAVRIALHYLHTQVPQN